MPRASCTRRPGDTASRCRGRGTYSPDASRSTSPPSPGEEPRAHRVDERARQARVLVERVVDVQKIVAPVLVEAASHGRVRELAVPPPGLRVD